MNERVVVNGHVTPRLISTCITDLEQFEIDVPIGDFWFPTLDAAAKSHIADIGYEPRYICIVFPVSINPEYGVNSTYWNHR